MLIEELISPSVPVLDPSDTGTQALHMMEDAHLTALPLVSGEEYLGLVQEHDVLDWSTPDNTLSSGDFGDNRPAVHAQGHPFDALRMAHDHNLSIVPVIDSGLKYRGVVTRDGLLRYFAEHSGLDNPGGIIVLQMEPHSYSLAELAKLSENEDVTLISTQVSNNRTTGLLEVTLKTNRTNLEALIASLERHGYEIKEIFGAQAGQEDVKDRYDELMHYLNM